MGEMWHYLVAHGHPDAEPAPDDIVTDLNPWFSESDKPWPTGHLHGTREAVQERLRQAGCTAEVVALRGVETIIARHTLRPGDPASVYRPAA